MSACASACAFNGRLRDELLNKTLFTSLAQARVALGCWRADYNDARPHSQLGWRTPAEFAFTFHPRRDLTLRYAEGSAPAPVATTAQPGKSNSQGAKANSGPDKTWGQGQQVTPILRRAKAKSAARSAWTYLQSMRVRARGSGL
jgi:hypothetical protein